MSFFILEIQEAIDRSGFKGFLVTERGLRIPVELEEYARTDYFTRKIKVQMIDDIPMAIQAPSSDRPSEGI